MAWRVITYVAIGICAVMVVGIALGLITSLYTKQAWKSKFKSPEMVARRLNEYVARNKQLPASLAEISGGVTPVYLEEREYHYKLLMVNGRKYGLAIWSAHPARVVSGSRLRQVALSGIEISRKGETVIVAVPESAGSRGNQGDNNRVIND